MNIIKIQVCSLILLGSAALLMSGCETTKASLPAPIVTAPPVPIATEPAPPPPLIIPARPLSERVNEALIRHAGNYASLMQEVNFAEQGAISTPEHLNSMMDGLSRVYSPSIGPALIGYGALIGAQNSEFVDGVLETARYRGIDTVIYQLYADPDYVTTFPGAKSGAIDITNAWASDIATIGRAGANVKRQSYELQKRSEWKKKRADSRPERIDAISRARSIRYDPPQSTKQSLAAIGAIRGDDVFGSEKRRQFWQVYGRSSAPQTQTFQSQYRSQMNKRALTLAALEVLGATDQNSTTWIENYMTSPGLTQCVNTARLNAAQCLAAGHFKYEDAFCVAEHELSEISNCMTKSAM